MGSEGEVKKSFKKLSKKFANQKIWCTFAVPFGNESEKTSAKFFRRSKNSKIFEIKFADSKKLLTFAIPLDENGTGHQPNRLVFLAPNVKIIDKTDWKYKQVPRNKKSRALISLRN